MHTAEPRVPLICFIAWRTSPNSARDSLALGRPTNTWKPSANTRISTGDPADRAVRANFSTSGRNRSRPPWHTHVGGAVSVMTGLHDHSLGVLAIGLGVLADVTGSAVLIWRFRAERRQAGQSGARESRAAIIVAIALATVSAVLIIESAAALASRSHPVSSGVALAASGISLAVLGYLAWCAPTAPPSA
jgi:hypothetical protein